MHDHNNNDSKDEHKGMMWMMMVCCLVPIVILFGGGAFLKSLGLGWVGGILIVGFLIYHFRNMFKTQDEQKLNNNVENSKDLSDHSNHKGCCH